MILRYSQSLFKQSCLITLWTTVYSKMLTHETSSTTYVSHGKSKDRIVGPCPSPSSAFVSCKAHALHYWLFEDFQE